MNKKERIEKLGVRRKNALRLHLRSQRMADKYYEQIDAIDILILKISQSPK